MLSMSMSMASYLLMASVKEERSGSVARHSSSFFERVVNIRIEVGRQPVQGSIARFKHGQNVLLHRHHHLAELVGDLVEQRVVFVKGAFKLAGVLGRPRPPTTKMTRQTRTQRSSTRPHTNAVVVVVVMLVVVVLDKNVADLWWLSW